MSLGISYSYFDFQPQVRTISGDNNWSSISEILRAPGKRDFDEWRGRHIARTWPRNTRFKVTKIILRLQSEKYFRFKIVVQKSVWLCKSNIYLTLIRPKISSVSCLCFVQVAKIVSVDRSANSNFYTNERVKLNR